MIRFCLLFTMSLVAGCADLTVPLAPPEQDAAGKSLAAAPPDMAAIYVYSGKKAGVSPIVVDRRHVGSLGPSTWLRIELPAGAHDLSCAFKDSNPGYVSSAAAAADPKTTWGAMTSRPIDVQSAGTYFFEIGFRVQWVGGFLCTIAEVSDVAGRAAILAGRRAASVASP